MKKILSIILAAVMLAACQQTPKEVKEKYGSSSQQETSAVTAESTPGTPDLDSEKVDISQLDAYNAKLKDYVKQKEYDNNFTLPENLKINSVSELYNFKMKQVSGAHEKFPEIYNYCFGRDFKKDSGVDSINKFTTLGEDEKESPGFYQRHIYYDYISYIDSKGYNKETGYYTTGVYVMGSGFVMYTDNDSYAYDNYELCKQVYYSKGEQDSEQYLMSDGSQCSPDEAKVYAEKNVNGLLGIINNDFEYKARLLHIRRNDEGKHTFSFYMQKYFKGVPLGDMYIPDFWYESDTHTKWITSDCFMTGKDKIVGATNNSGLEKLESAEKITGKLIPVTKAVDIMHEKLAEHIKLDIFNVQLLYLNEYDASDYVKAVQAQSNSGSLDSLSDEQKKLLFSRDRIEGMEYNCFPVWVFSVASDWKKPNKYGVTDNENKFSYIIVNAQTGEMKYYTSIEKKNI